MGHTGGLASRRLRILTSHLDMLNCVANVKYCTYRNVGNSTVQSILLSIRIGTAAIVSIPVRLKLLIMTVIN